jgi:hypothetical protein
VNSLDFSHALNESRFAERELAGFLLSRSLKLFAKSKEGTMSDLLIRVSAVIFCGLIGGPAIVRIWTALGANRDPIRRW